MMTKPKTRMVVAALCLGVWAAPPALAWKLKPEATAMERGLAASSHLGRVGAGRRAGLRDAARRSHSPARRDPAGLGRRKLAPPRRGRRLGGLGGRCGVAAGLIEHLLDLRGAELGQLGLPRLSQSPEIIVEFVDSDRDPGGLGEIGVPVVAPGAKY